MKIVTAGDAIVVTEATDEQKKAIAGIAKNKQPQPDLWTTSEVAAVCRVHKKSIARWAKAGLLRPIHIGHRKVMYDAAEVIEFACNGNKSQSALGVAGQETKWSLEKNKTNGGV